MSVLHAPFTAGNAPRRTPAEDTLRRSRTLHAVSTIVLCLLTWAGPGAEGTAGAQDRPIRQAVALEPDVHEPVEFLDESPATAKPLPRPSYSPRVKSGNKTSSSGSWATTTSGLCIVLTLFGAAAYWFRRRGAQLLGILPADVVQVLGKRYIDQRNCIQLIRVGSRILVLGQSNQHGLQTLAEITDPVEVDMVAGQCRQQTQYSVSRSFAELLHGQHPDAPAASQPPAPPPPATEPELPDAFAPPYTYRGATHA